MIKTRKNYSAKQLMLINEMAETMRRLFAANAAEHEADAQTGEKWQSLARARRETVSSLQDEAYYIAEIAKKLMIMSSRA